MFYCIGWTIFLLPNEITSGGVAGVSSILFWGLKIPVHYSYFAINAVLMIFALRTLGYQFLIKTIYAITILTLISGWITSNYPNIQFLEDQPFMAAVLGAMFSGMGIGLGLSARGSTGGTDIVAAIINKYYDISLGRVILITDVIIITSSYLVLRDWEKVVYGYVELMVCSFCVDMVINSRQRSVQFFIISNKYKEIAKLINLDPHRGCTVIDAEGFYTQTPIKMLFVLARKSESARILALINTIDPRAFVSQSYVHGVYGEGFAKMKSKQRKLPKDLIAHSPLTNETQDEQKDPQ